MSTQHTQGPWKFHLGRGANPRFHIQDVAGYQIASTSELSKHAQAADENEMRESNARLIAAAPELLAELTRITDLYATAMKNAGVTAYPEALADVRHARATIAKVKGGNP